MKNTEMKNYLSTPQGTMFVDACSAFLLNGDSMDDAVLKATNQVNNFLLDCMKPDSMFNEVCFQNIKNNYSITNNTLGQGMLF